MNSLNSIKNGFSIVNPQTVFKPYVQNFYSSIYVMGTNATGYKSFKLFAGKNTEPYVSFDNSDNELIHVMYDENGIGYGARVKNGGDSSSFFIDGSSNFVSITAVRLSSVSLYNSNKTIDAVISLGNSSHGHFFITKYNINMKLSWYVKIIANDPYYFGYQFKDYIMTDNNNNVIAVGRHTASPLIFYSVNNTTNIQINFTLKQTDNWVTSDGFVVKYSETGVLQWVRRLGFVASINGMNIDSSNNIYLCGLAISPFVVFGTDNTTAYKTFTVPSGYNANVGGAFVVKYSPTGDILLATYVVTGANINGSSLNTWESKSINNNPLVNSNNEMFLVLSGNNAGLGTNYIYDSNNTTTNFLNTQQWNVEVIKYGNDNLFKWVNTIVSANQIPIYSAILDNSSNIHLSGTFSNTLNVYNNNQTLYNSYTRLGNADIFTIKYSNDSSMQWVSTIKSSGNDTFRSASIDNSGNYILFGGYNGILNIYYNNTIQYSPTFDTSTNDLFLIKYNTNGTINFATHMGGKSDETGAALMTLDNNNNIYITAGYTDRIYFYNSNNNITASNSLAADLSGNVFVAKYNSSGIYQWGVISTGVTSTPPTPYRLVTDRKNNVIAYGVFVSPTLTFYDSSGNTNFMDISNNTNVTYPTDFYIVKYDSSGVGKWARRLGDNNYYKNNIGSNIRR